MTVYFNGKVIKKPGAYSAIDASGMTSLGGASGRVLAFIGNAGGGAPQTIIDLASPSMAKKVYKSGDLLENLQVAWSPAKTVPGANVIKGIRVNKATQAETDLNDTTEPVAEAVITLKAKDYGTLGTYKVKVVAGTSGHIVLSITDGTLTEVSTEIDNNAQAVVDWVNSNAILVTATLKGLGTATLATTTDFMAFATAGTNPEPTELDWQVCIDMLITEDVAGIVVLTPDETVQAYLDSHISLMNSRNKERRGFYCHADDDTVDTIITRAINFGNSKAVIASPGIKRADSGTLKTSAMYTASAIAGAWAGGANEEPLTLDLINCLGLAKNYDDTDIERLQDAGVTVIEKAKTGYRIVQALTTYQGENDLYRELFVDSIATDMDVELREFLENKFAGKRRTTTDSTSVYNHAISKLEQYVKRGWLIGGVDATGAEIPPYRNVAIRKEGTAWFVDWEGSPAVPNNYLLITSHFTF